MLLFLTPASKAGGLHIGISIGGPGYFYAPNPDYGYRYYNGYGHYHYYRHTRYYRH